MLMLLMLSKHLAESELRWKLYQFLRQGPQHHPKTSSGIIIGALRTTRCETEEDLQPLTPTAAQSLPSYWSTTGIEVDFSNPLDRRTRESQRLHVKRLTGFSFFMRMNDTICFLIQNRSLLTR